MESIYDGAFRILPKHWDSLRDEIYELSLLGVPLFALGGIGDMFWHIVFGFEVGIEPLLSPTHLVLAMSGLFILSEPLRAALRRSSGAAESGWSGTAGTVSLLLP